MKKKILNMMAVALTLIMLPTAAMAESVGVTGGGLGVTNGALSFSSVTLDLSTNQSSTATSTVSIVDDRGTGAGWGISLAATDFQSASIADPSSSGSGQFVVRIPASAVSVTFDTPSLVGGQAIDGTAGPRGYSRTLSTSAQNIVNASPGYGMGAYDIVAHYTLSIPKSTTIVSMSGTGSKYSVGGTVGTIATTYTSTFTFTNVVGI